MHSPILTYEVTRLGCGRALLITVEKLEDFVRRRKV